MYTDVKLIIKRLVNMERGRDVSTDNVWDKEVKDQPETLHDDGYQKASAHASLPRCCVAWEGAGTSTNSTSEDQDALVARWVALQPVCFGRRRRAQGGADAAAARGAVS